MNLTMIGVGNLMEVIWPVIGRVVGGDDVAERLIGVTADDADIERKRSVFGFPILLHDNLGALRRNHPDVIMFAPPPTIAPQLIDTVLRAYYTERRADGGPLPVLYAFHPSRLGRPISMRWATDVLVVNMIPNNVTSIAGHPVVDEGHYTVTYAAPWPEERVRELRDLFAGQGAYVEVEPHQIVPMLGGLAVIGSLWDLLPVIADRLGGDHNHLGGYLRARVRDLTGFAPPRSTAVDDIAEPAGAEYLASLARAWHDGIARYYEQTDLAPQAARTFLHRHLDLTLHTVQAEPREVLNELAVGAATKGGVLERAIRCGREDLLPALTPATEPDWDHVTDLITTAAHTRCASTD